MGPLDRLVRQIKKYLNPNEDTISFTVAPFKKILIKTIKKKKFFQ